MKKILLAIVSLLLILPNVYGQGFVQVKSSTPFTESWSGFADSVIQATSKSKDFSKGWTIQIDPILKHLQANTDLVVRLPEWTYGEKTFRTVDFD